MYLHRYTQIRGRGGKIYAPQGQIGLMKPHGILVAMLLCKGQFSHHLLLTSICGAIFFGINISQEFVRILHLQDGIDKVG